MSETAWRSFHLFYHGDRDLALRRFVAPSVRDLWHERRIESFFFIRYSLGGPHLRIRVLPHASWADEVTESLEHAAAEFLAACPSTTPRREEEIRRENRGILASDPYEQDDAVYPDNSFLPFSVRFETERYGGTRLLPASLDFFALSSVQALRFLAEHAGQTAGSRLTQAFRVLARQGLGLAENGAELIGLFDDAVESWPQLKAIADRADQVYDQRRETFRGLLSAQLAALGGGPAGDDPGYPGWEVECSRRLAREIAAAPRAVRRRIGGSQMHMTANRLGLLNTDEVYLGRLLGRAARDLTVERLTEALAAASGAGHRGGSLHDLLSPAFHHLFQDRESSATFDGGLQACSKAS